jgi:hypothetical protein
MKDHDTQLSGLVDLFFSNKSFSSVIWSSQKKAANSK